VDFYHSAAFTWDAKVVIFGDESTDGDSSSAHGKIWFHSRASGATLGSFQIPRPQGPDDYCSAHMFHVLKTGHGYRLVAAWYTGGVTVIDFAQPSRAREVAFYDPFLAGDTEGLWSAYAYNGFVYSNGLFRGFDSYFVPRHGRAARSHRSTRRPSSTTRRTGPPNPGGGVAGCACG